MKQSPLPNNSLRSFLLSLFALSKAESLLALSRADIFSLTPASLYKNKEEISLCLSQLEKEGIIFSCNDLYSHKNTPNDDEIKKLAKTSQQKISRNRFLFSLMQAIPFIEATAITGSVSMCNAKEHSDIDLLCVVKDKRIWTARFFLLVLTELFGKRRERKNNIDKICLNCFVTKDALFPFQNIASAHMLSRSLPLFGNDMLKDFFKSNNWISSYFSHPAHQPIIYSSHLLRAISTSLSWILSGSIGNALEHIFARWQIKRLRRKVKQGSHADGLLFRDDVVTLFYPENKNTIIMSRYTEMMKEIDF